MQEITPPGQPIPWSLLGRKEEIDAIIDVTGGRERRPTRNQHADQAAQRYFSEFLVPLFSFEPTNPVVLITAVFTVCVG